ncbi:hypothetical protein GF324_04575 [bacterium]|nr:hypothetical protein [bacterium]
MAFAPSKRQKHKKDEDTKLNLSSMMDMMTIILLFLLKSFSASGQLMQPAPGIELPESTADMQPKQVLALYLMPNQGLILHKEGEAFENLPVIAPVDELQVEEDVMVPALESLIYDRNETNAGLNLPPIEEVTIQADQGVPYSWVLKVVQTASGAGIAKFDFVIQQKS